MQHFTNIDMVQALIDRYSTAAYILATLAVLSILHITATDYATVNIHRYTALLYSHTLPHSIVLSSDLPVVILVYSQKPLESQSLVRTVNSLLCNHML
jgi:hypothetical protein